MSIQTEFILAAIITAVVVFAFHRARPAKIASEMVLAAIIFLVVLLWMGGKASDAITETVDPILGPILQWGFVALCAAAGIQWARGRWRQRKIKRGKP